MAEQSHRAQIAGIDVVTYPTAVKDVVVIVGALPAGDAMGSGGNIAIPTLAGMMLDRGTRALDKFAIADRLDSVGAEISFAVGVQSLEIRGKCLKKDLPLVMDLIAADLRTPALQAQEFAKAKQQFIGSLAASLQNTEGRAHEAFGRAVFPEGHPNRPHSIAEYITAAKAASLDELKAFIVAYYGPAHMTLLAGGRRVGARRRSRRVQSVLRLVRRARLHSPGQARGLLRSARDQRAAAGQAQRVDRSGAGDWPEVSGSGCARVARSARPYSGMASPGA